MIVNKQAVFPHINNYQLRQATVEIDQQMKGKTLQIVVTAAQNDAIGKAQKSKGVAKIEHVKLAVRGNFPDGKALNPDDAKLLRAVGAIVGKYNELELTMDGFLQVKGAPKMVDAAVKVAVQVEPKQADTAEKEQDETVEKEAEQIEPKQTKSSKKETAKDKADKA